MDCQGQEDSQSGGIAADVFFAILFNTLIINYIYRGSCKNRVNAV